MLKPRREMFAAPAASSRACMLWKTLSNSAARAFEARKSADGIRTRSPFVAISGMRLSFVAISKIHAGTPAGMLPGLSLFSKQSEIGSTLQAYRRNDVEVD
jgi:hypothetical protein